ncbi:zinc-binding alcohol dehydrogenase family protein [Hyphomicrobium sp. DY-1]|uniref:zinc-binding alcohol dehydrogenase family protein n=1 Tax=Hyphomicrobium sp. DY-1 TaxID=3075650 RepID=UPI0039C3728C
MKAIGYRVAGPITAKDALIDIELPDPTPRPRDIVVAVKAVSVNPADVKLRAAVSPPDFDGKHPSDQARILGFDAAGIVKAVGSDVSMFKPGDEVFYAGTIDRPGTNSELHLVDERIVGRKPKTLNFAEAAALPLTSITAWELLFDRLGVAFGNTNQKGSLLIINGAGGVGSILTQIARKLTGLTVIATASRPETIAWCKTMGAHHVVDHHKPLMEQIATLGISGVEYVAGLTATDKHLPEIERVLLPQGKLALIDDPAVLDIVKFKRKSISVHWELMFTRPLYQTADMVAQHKLLDNVADLVDTGVLKTTLSEIAGPINADTLKRVHQIVESGKAFGKMVLEGF